MSAPCPLFGFRVTFRSGSQLAESLAALLDARGLIAELETHAGRTSLVVSSEAGQATEADRDAVLEWSRHVADPDIDVSPLGDLRDAD